VPVEHIVGRLRAGGRAELRRQLREVERWRRLTIVAVVFLLLGAYPAYLVLQTATRDQVLNSLDTLAVPAWAAGEPTDAVFGSRWCFRECRFRERSLISQRSPEETAQVYERVLSEAGWQRWHVDRCPEQEVPGFYSCWRRDEYTLDLWVREPACAFDPLRNRPTVGPEPAEPATDPAADPSADPSASPDPGADDCTGAAVTIKVRLGIADDRLRGGTPPPPPEDPDFPTLVPSLLPEPTGVPG